MSLGSPTTPAVVGDKFPILILSDLATGVAALMESQIYTGKLDGRAATMHCLVGIISRYVEGFIAKQNVAQSFMSNDYRQQKNQLIMFCLSYLTSSRNSFRYALSGVNADLLGKWMTDSTFDDRVLFEM